MKYFTYNDYIKSIHVLKMNAFIKVADRREIYKKEKNNKSDEDMLNNPDIVVQILNKYLKIEDKIKTETLIRYTNKFLDITETYVYKLVNTEIYFVLQLAKTPNKEHIYKITRDCINVMRKYSKRYEKGVQIRIPIIIPLIVYKGRKKWEIKEIEKISNNKYEINEYNSNYFKYNIIHLN